MNKNIDEKLSDALEINIDAENSEIIHDGGSAGGHHIIPTNEDFQLKRDYTLVRKNLKEIIDNGNTAIDGILNVATETE